MMDQIKCTFQQGEKLSIPQFQISNISQTWIQKLMKQISAQVKEKQKVLEQIKQVKDKSLNELPLSSIKKLMGLHKNDFLKILRQAIKEFQNSPKGEIEKINNFVCPVCLTKFHLRFQRRFGKCGHCFCEGCLLQYIKMKLQSFEKVTCLDGTCKESLDPEAEIINLLDKKLQHKFEKVHHYYEVLNNSNIKHCPTPQCKGRLHQTQNHQRDVYCKECKKQICWECLLLSHKGACDSNEGKFLTKTFGYQQCPKCKFFVEKTQGCNKMHCQCQNDFCYKCGQQWEVGHECRKKPKLMIQDPVTGLLQLDQRQLQQQQAQFRKFEIAHQRKLLQQIAEQKRLKELAHQKKLEYQRKAQQLARQQKLEQQRQAQQLARQQKLEQQRQAQQLARQQKLEQQRQAQQLARQQKLEQQRQAQQLARQQKLEQQRQAQQIRQFQDLMAQVSLLLQ